LTVGSGQLTVDSWQLAVGSWQEAVAVCSGQLSSSKFAVGSSSGQK